MSYTHKRHNVRQVRNNTFKHIQRRINILKNVYDGNKPNIDNCTAFRGFTNNGEVHRLSKGKIHCSCPMCRKKSKEIGFKHSDKVNMEKGKGN